MLMQDEEAENPKQTIRRSKTSAYMRPLLNEGIIGKHSNTVTGGLYSELSVYRCRFCKQKNYCRKVAPKPA